MIFLIEASEISERCPAGHVINTNKGIFIVSIYWRIPSISRPSTFPSSSCTFKFSPLKKLFSSRYFYRLIDFKVSFVIAIIGYMMSK